VDRVTGPASEGASPALSVVIPCYRQAGPLERCLRALERQRVDVPFEVIVVDSGGDAVVAAVAGSVAGVRLVREGAQRPRLRAGEARNLGARHARASVLAFTDADCIPDPEWLGAALAALTPGVRLVGGPVLDALPFHPVAVSDNLLQFADFPATRPDEPAAYFPGCNLAIRRADFDRVGGFPPVPLPAGEDTSFCEAVLAQWPTGVRFARSMRVRHLGRTGLRAFLRHQATFGFCRGVLGLHLRAAHRRLGVLTIMIVPVALKRLAYILARRARWAPARLPAELALLPLLVPGLLAWAVGFRRGLRVARQRAG